MPTRTEIHWGVMRGSDVLTYDDQEDAEQHARDFGGTVVRQQIDIHPWESPYSEEDPF